MIYVGVTLDELGEENIEEKIVDLVFNDTIPFKMCIEAKNTFTFHNGASHVVGAQLNVIGKIKYDYSALDHEPKKWIHFMRTPEEDTPPSRVIFGIQMLGWYTGGWIHHLSFSALNDVQAEVASKLATLGYVGEVNVFAWK